MDDLQPGRRVVVRYSLEPGDTHSTSDALGVVTAVDEAGLEIDTKRGPLRIAREQVLLVHEVPRLRRRPDARMRSSPPWICGASPLPPGCLRMCTGCT
ncbi:putative acetyltransferase [Brevibacterium siliguriense]|uniref:putative acetyltransferase n=1 Tax=Brevibacterium siliguriense TaxID=1136497 RepID=UPI000AA4CB44|nr:hypothetical protein [Brevibacterium siliguriense]